MGTIYGTAIWSGLLLTLFLAPDGEQLMVTLTPLTCVLSLVGHRVDGIPRPVGASPPAPPGRDSAARGAGHQAP